MSALTEQLRPCQTPGARRSETAKGNRNRKGLVAATTPLHKVDHFLGGLVENTLYFNQNHLFSGFAIGARIIREQNVLRAECVPVLLTVTPHSLYHAFGFVRSR